MRISLITLGCSKNTVDSEKLAGIFKANGVDVLFDDLSRSDVAIINTCGFISDSQKESIDTIFSCIKMKNNSRYRLSRVYVIGCLVSLHRRTLRSNIPEVDGWYGVNDIEKMAIGILKDCEFSNKINKNEIYRSISTPSHYAYLKIAEGCNKFCSFCAIPLIRGHHISRPKEEILKEAEFLASQGVKELILISQDLTYYGMDLYNSLEICDLVKQLSSIGFDWIRLHYAHPNEINDDVLELFNTVPNLCKYLDIPLQHISTPILKSMKRNINREETIALVKHIREVVPDVAIRTTFIVGYPGETEKQFDELIDFVISERFNRLGVFTFSSEYGTAAHVMIDDVDPAIKQERKDKLMEIQQKIALENNKKFVGKPIKVLIDRKEGEYNIGRTQYDSPEVDNEVLVLSDDRLRIGNFYNSFIFSADSYDLYGKTVVEKP